MELDNMKTTPDTAGTESNGQSTENDKTPQTQTEPGEQPGTGKDSVGKGQHDAEVVYRPSTTTREDEEDDQEKDVRDTPDKPHPPTGKFVFVLTFFATLGGFLMGYDIGIVSGSMLFFRPYFKLSTFWTEAIVSAAVGTAAVSSLAGGWVTDKIGRRPSLLIGSVIFSIGGVVMGAAPNKELLLVGRMICGLGIGLASVVVPIYVAESSPVHMRGRLTLMWQMMINLGILISSLIAGGFSYLPRSVSWRYMLGLSAVPGVIQFIGFLFMPESPRWLVEKGHVKRAQRVLVQIRGVSDVSAEMRNIQASVEEAQAQQLKGLRLLGRILSTPHTRRALLVGVGLLVFQQWCGINTAIYYSGTVMKMAGFPVKAAVWLVVLPNALLFLSGLIGIHIVDQVGRRPLLLWSMVGTIGGLAVIATGFQLSETYTPTIDTAVIETYSNGTPIGRCYNEYQTCLSCVKDDGCGFCNKRGDTSGSCLPTATNEEQALYGRCNVSEANGAKFRFAHGYCPSDKYSWITTLGIALFVLLFAPGMAPMPWTINAEIYPLWARGTCNAIAATSAWISNLIISFTFLSLTEAITIYGVFWMFMGFSLLGLLFFFLLVPETRGKSLEQVEELFMNPIQKRRWRSVRRDSLVAMQNHPVVDNNP
ncbi:proton myo-inositol cotransporter-like [Littorina saxatilis]|uniref:Major facilitator superfamily (MFS) profile domain-containing protein n=1 Tax=Littorina saxatilis TaxID=31220 RepID=A0AAN9BBE3_9CAEN